jgi:hypothetical protein
MPAELQYLLAMALISVTLISVGALAGLYVGQRLAESKQIPPPPEPIRVRNLAIGLDRCLTGGHDIARQSAALLEAFRTQATPTKPAILAALERLDESTHRLVQQIDRLQQLQAASPSKQPAEAEADAGSFLALRAGNDPKLSSAEISNFTGQPEAGAGPELRTRHAYDCYQRLAPWNDGDPLPTPDEMISVRCHDLSVEGISFFLLESPTFDLAVISLGQNTGVMMVIEVRHSKAVYMHGQLQHLVGCRFVRRIERKPVAAHLKAAI